MVLLPVALTTGTLSLQQVGGALGLAVLATLSTTRSNSLLAGGVPAAYALIDGYHIAFATGAVLVIAAIVLTLTLPRTRERRAGGRLRRRGTGRVPLTALECRSSIGAALGLRGHPPRGRLRPQPH